MSNHKCYLDVWVQQAWALVLHLGPTKLEHDMEESVRRFLIAGLNSLIKLDADDWTALTRMAHLTESEHSPWLREEEHGPEIEQREY